MLLMKTKRTFNKGKMIQVVIGFILLLPPIFGVFSYFYTVFKGYPSRKEEEIEYRMDEGTPVIWDLGFKNNQSNILIYMGLMALAGCYLIKGNVKELYREDE